MRYFVPWIIDTNRGHDISVFELPEELALRIRIVGGAVPTFQECRNNKNIKRLSYQQYDGNAPIDSLAIMEVVKQVKFETLPNYKAGTWYALFREFACGKYSLIDAVGKVWYAI